MAKKPRNRTADYATYLAVRALVAVVQMVSPRVAYAVADFLAWLVYKLVKSRRRIALENLRAAFPELGADPARADRLVRAMYRHFLRAGIEFLLLPRKLHISNWRKHLVMAQGEQTLRLLLDGRATLLITGHFGNWEMSGFVMGLFGFRTHGIARILDNPYLERFALKLRQRTGQRIISKADYEGITAVMKTGGKLGALADQDAGPKGVFVDFFGRPASTHRAIALLALEHDAVVVVMGVPRVSRSAYPQRADYDPTSALAPLFYAARVVDVIDPREYASDVNAVRAITARFTSALERLIREYPEQYFWLHRRWKHQPKAKGKTAAEPKRAA
jgi:KDO2-lipid IV(A) lauroyltransferase